MNEKMKFIAGFLVFGSMWGFTECIIAPILRDAGLPGGAIMTGVFAMLFLTMSRLIYPRRGMQIGMGLTAGALRLFNPFGGCQVCSAIALMGEGLLFELIWNYLATDKLGKLNSLTTKVSMGIFTSYCVFVVGYIITQILTPLVYGSFYLENFLSMMPQYFARGLPAGLIGGMTIPLVLSLRTLNVTVKDKLYYPTTLGVTAVCWITVIGLSAIV